ncbi:MAG TPA: PEGA domain-containing protein, partial [Polyangiaceae bacterium]|nr:PEGA domain-containing protein [Polyangiaceae bacterium]
MSRRTSRAALFTTLCLFASTQLARAADAPKNAPSKTSPPGKVAPAKDAPPSQDGPAGPDAANKAEAARRFDRGLSLFNEGDNAGALAEFKQTYAIMPNPIVLYNIGLVYAAMGRPVDAVDALTAVVNSSALSPEQHERAQSTLSDQQARIGRVSVTTAPDGARIDVDGVEVATTPLSAPLRVAEGSHVIGAVAEGYAHAHKEIVVAGNADASVSFTLVLGQNKVPANLTVHSRTLDANVKVDDKAAGTTPLATSLSIPSGHHLVELSRPGYQTLKQEIDLGEGATGDVTLDLAIDPGSLAANGADFVIDSREPNVEVTVDDERLGLYSTPLRLPQGAHHVKLRVAGYLPYETDVKLEAGKPFVLS